MSYESLLIDRMHLQTKSSSQNDFGEWSYSYASSTDQTKCRMSPLSAMERQDQSGRFDDVKYKCFCLSSASIARDNRLIWNGDTYRIKEVILDSSKHHKTGYLVLTQ